MKFYIQLKEFLIKTKDKLDFIYFKFVFLIFMLENIVFLQKWPENIENLLKSLTKILQNSVIFISESDLYALQKLLEKLVEICKNSTPQILFVF